MNRAIGVAWCLAAAGALGGCTQHRVEVAPIEVKPIHMTVDINIKVDRELDEFFDFEEELAPAAAGAAKAPPAPRSPAQQGVQQ